MPNKTLTDKYAGVTDRSAKALAKLIASCSPSESRKMKSKVRKLDRMAKGLERRLARMMEARERAGADGERR
jgi:hypothetical protein